MSMEITKNDLDKIVPKFRKALGRSHDLTALDLWGNIRENSPVDQGRLAGSWKLEKKGDLHSSVATNVGYALVQDQGSDPYEIFPRVAKALRFVVGGQTIFAKSVLHPGIAGTNYIGGSIAQTESRLPEFIQMALDEQGL